MKERDEISQWFEQAGRPTAPSWFTAKTLARLRRESKPSPFLSAWYRWRWAGACAVAVVSGLLAYSNMESNSRLNNDRIYAALDAFVEYEEENQQWEEVAWLLD